MAAVVDRRAQPLGQADTLIDTTQEHRAEIRREGAAAEVAAHAQAGDRRKTQLLWGSLRRRATSFGFFRSVLGGTPIISMG